MRRYNICILYGARKFYSCTTHRYIVSNECGKTCHVCSECSHYNRMTNEITYVGHANICSGGYVQGLVTYMVTDDLSTTPMSAVTGISVLKKFKASNFDVFEERVVEFTIADVELEFVEASLKSKQVLTDVFLPKQWPCVGGTPGGTDTGKRIALKLLIDTRANRVLFAEAGKDFVDFLCSLLSLPVGNVIKKLTTSAPAKTMVGCIGNVHRSYTNFAENYMLPNKTKNTLLDPDVSKFSYSVPLLWSSNSGPSDPTKLYFCNSDHRYFTDELGNPCPSCHIPMQTLVNLDTSNVPKDEEGYVKGLVRFMVTDDLCATPLSLVSCIPVLNDMWSVEHPAKLGFDEALKLLKACLRSKMALSDVYLVKDEVNNFINQLTS